MIEKGETEPSYSENKVGWFLIVPSKANSDNPLILCN